MMNNEMMRQLQARIQKMQEELAQETVEATAGGGAVSVTISEIGMGPAQAKLRSIKIAPEAVDPEDVETLEEMVLTAIGDASAKAEQLAARARAALVVYWRELDRQVRVRGPVEPLAAAESDAYFATRPRPSQVAAWASPQSRPLRDRAELDALVAEAEGRFADGAVPRPEGWGGYLLRPQALEFWQGQVGRLHDRFRYVREGGGWRIERLAP